MSGACTFTDFGDGTDGTMVCTVATRTLPSTGATSAPVVGSAFTFTLLGIVAVLASRRRVVEGTQR
jgi:LPXTG-motif cell wall-anchored protein